MSPSLDRICYYLKPYKAAGYAGVNGETGITGIDKLPQNYLDDNSARTKAIDPTLDFGEARNVNNMTQVEEWH